MIIAFVSLQRPKKKIKLHDTFEEMARFSEVWKKYLVLYDEKKRNARFSEDFKSARPFMKQCYADMGRELALTPDEVWKHRVKYVDGITKGLSQLKMDIQNGTSVCPIPAVHKLRIFRWFWPYSKNYDADVMEDALLDGYMERALLVEVNKLERAKQDLTEARDALRKVRDLYDKRELEELGLKTAQECEEDLVTFDDSSMLSVIEDVSPSECSSLICAYLPPSRDPTFHYAERGFVFFTTSVSMTTGGASVKSVRKHSDILLSTLKSSGEVAHKARQALCHAQIAEALYIDAVAALIGHVAVDSDGEKSEHDLILSNAGVLRCLSEFDTSVCDAVQVAQLYAAQYDVLRDTASSVSLSCLKVRTERAIADIAHLRDLRKNSKMFSSDKWVCTLIQQL